MSRSEQEGGSVFRMREMMRKLIGKKRGRDYGETWTKTREMGGLKKGDGKGAALGVEGGSGRRSRWYLRQRYPSAHHPDTR